ncbi:class I SAM-dependent methyltransferase [Deinococcus maricopensis]|uniref:Methyltransferase type 11 n=1 Tax=Deinococcus maricopensis (strain DSM 21211 / LMG 22137 / NRRL B-23946 / LB-34) TaxID=709986 RepID=E8U6I8_DEIML|nr:class I SAM-dependent methyltransferase [Deinococcus maricopensis]ADV66677.1 Methyltransferase type 11 [Deinococcus maricopensis DSM 21211]
MSALTPHSREWYAALAARTGGYVHPWRQTLAGPSGEALFDALLEPLLTPDTRVLEAGCGHGVDAARFAPRVAHWTGYDFTPASLVRAQRDVPGATFVEWDSSSAPIPAGLRGPFDLIVSRRGPTSVIPHLRTLAAPGARVLGVHAGGEAVAARIAGRLALAGLEVATGWSVRVRGHLPTFQDARLHTEFNGGTLTEAEWAARVTADGLPFMEERYVWLARLP